MRSRAAPKHVRDRRVCLREPRHVAASRSASRRHSRSVTASRCVTRCGHLPRQPAQTPADAVVSRRCTQSPHHADVASCATTGDGGRVEAVAAVMAVAATAAVVGVAMAMAIRPDARFYTIIDSLYHKHQPRTPLFAVELRSLSSSWSSNESAPWPTPLSLSSSLSNIIITIISGARRSHFGMIAQR